MKSPDYSRNQELIKAYLEAESDAKANMYANQVVELNTPLVYAAIKRWYPCYYSSSFFEDIVQAGLFGIFEALRHYSLDVKTAFSTFATHYIKGSISQTICEETNKTSPHFTRMGRIIKEAEEKLKGEGVKEPTREQIAAETGLSFFVIDNALNANNIGNTVCLDDISQMMSSENVERDVEEKALKEMLMDAVLRLPKEYRLIIGYSFGLLNGIVYTAPQISRIIRSMGIDVSSSRVKAMKNAAIKMLFKNPGIQKFVMGDDFYDCENPFEKSGPFTIPDKRFFQQQMQMLEELDAEGLNFDFSKEFVSSCKKIDAM